jgi:hypothetical protein
VNEQRLRPAFVRTAPDLSEFLFAFHFRDDEQRVEACSRRISVRGLTGGGREHHTGRLDPIQHSL